MTGRRRCAPAEVEAALAALDQSPRRVPASDWRSLGPGLRQSGLYSWWVDAGGANDLASGLGVHLAAGRIYAGLTGATNWPSGKAGVTTLADRIGQGHLRGWIGNSTFRQTLAACLREGLDLRPWSTRRLARESERALGEWMLEHLEVAIHPFPNRDTLADLEDRVRS